MIDNTYPEIIFCALRIAPVIVMVALLAYANKNRLMFCVGFAGCFLGLFFDRGGSTGGLLVHASVRANGFLFFGLIGASMGSFFGWLIKNKDIKLGKQISIFGLFALTALVAIVLAIYNML